MGSKQPKPDFVAGLLPTAFTEEEVEILEYYAKFTQPFRFTPGICFPFLMCEAKTGEKGFNEAERQNIHSAGIAVRAIIALYKEAFGRTNPYRVKELYGKVLAFTMSHDNDRIFLYGNFAVPKPGSPQELEFYRYPIELFSLTTRDGTNKYKPYNFVCNVYEKFAPIHLKRIKNAVAHLPSPPKRIGLSFHASTLTLDEAGSQQDDSAFQKPGKSASATLLQQLEQQRKESKEQLEQQRKESKEQIDKLLQQLEQQRQESKEQQREIISLLKNQRSDQSVTKSMDL